jgi:altronate hydrolase
MNQNVKLTDEKITTIRLHAEDNLVVAANEIEAGTDVISENVCAVDKIPAGHKIASEFIPTGKPLKKYNQIIGFASQDILPGEHIHIHNVKIENIDHEYAFSVDCRPTNYVKESDRQSFEGIVRPDGRVATRNYIGILPTVMCSAQVSRRIAEQFGDEIMSKYPNVDGVIGLVHSTGCGNPGLGLTFLQRTIAGYSRHPNFGGVLIVGLGCEDNHIEEVLDKTGLTQSEFLKTLSIQDTGGSIKTVMMGKDIIADMLPKLDKVERTTVTAANLSIGLECGGSDAYSGITANPALGYAADMIVKNGGTVILSETPEIYGAEHLLIKRAISEDVGRKIIESINWWKEYTRKNDAELSNNPSPGNLEGGITTIYEKSLGAVAKAGSSNLVEVYKYAESITKAGFVFMDTTSHDIASVTGKVAGGANVVCFTTGRGTPVGGKPVPIIKLATNTLMFTNQSDDMDINCGEILDGRITLEEMGNKIFKLILETASGKKTKSEIHNFGDLEFSPWQIGAVL